MTDLRSQSNYQVRLGWGAEALTSLAESGAVVIIDAIGTEPHRGSGLSAEDAAPCRGVVSGATEHLAAIATALPHAPIVFRASLRNASATAKAIRDEQVSRGGRLSVSLVLVGEGGAFAVEDYLAAGAVGNALSALGIDHSAPDAAVATEGFRSLTRALKHLIAASASGLALEAAGRHDEARAAAELDAETVADRVVS